MTVYFIRSNDLIKIGFSNDVKRRVTAVIGGLREGGEFLGCMPGGRDLEKHFHQVFAAYRIYGEWFEVNDNLERLIAVSTKREYPDDEKARSADRLLLQEERYAEEAAYFIQSFFTGMRPTNEMFDMLARITSIPAMRLEAIHRGEVCPITAGEYVVLRECHDASDGARSADHPASGD